MVIAINNWLGYLLILMLVFLIMYSSIIIHEIGHLIAGLLLRYKFLFLILGPFVISKENGNLTVRINKNNTNWGQCGMLPNFENYDIDRKKYILCLASGSIANTFTILLSIAFYFTSNNLLWLILIITHFFVGVLAIAPIRSDGIYYTDGLAIKILTSHTETSEFYYDLLKISYSLLFKKALKTKDNDTFENIEMKCMNISNRQFMDKNSTQREIVTYLLYELITWHLINGRFQRCIQLLHPFIKNNYLSGMLKEELIISYLYAKLAVEKKFEEPPLQLNFTKSNFHSIPKIRSSLFFVCKFLSVGIE